VAANDLLVAVVATALLVALVALLVRAWRNDPDRHWSRGDWEALTRIQGDDPVNLHWRAAGLLGQGRPEEAITEHRKLEVQGCAPVLFLNSLVEALVTAGRYQEAVDAAVSHDYPEEDWRPSERALVLINAAEALYNLGRWQESLELLAPLDADAAEDPLVQSGLHLQRSWILGALGQPEAARRQLQQVVPKALARSYWPEFHFSRACAAMAAGNFAAAAQELDTAERLTLRASTQRNLLFLRGRLALAQGDLLGGERWLARGAAHPFRYQGGDGLLLWGDSLQRLGRLPEARAAWELAAARDPQSASAREAGSRTMDVPAPWNGS